MVRAGDLYRIGRLGKPHGVRGELQFHFTDDVFDTTGADFLFVAIDGLPVPFQIEEYRFRSDDLAIIKFAGIDSQDAARELVGADVLFPRSEAEKAEEGLSLRALVDFSVIDSATGKTVGRIAAIDDATDNLLFSVMTTEGKEALLPAADELIKNIDTEGRSILMDIPEGLLDL